MAMERKQKKSVITKFASHKEDTGSPGVQIALLTHRINQLTAHLEIHRKDNHSRRGLLLMVGKRRKLLNYLQERDEVQYNDVITKLNLRK